MNKREVDEFLKPLKNRPDINPRAEFKQELRSELFEKKPVMNKRPFVHWIPNLVATAILVTGIYIGTDLIISNNIGDEVTPAQHLDSSDSEMIADITEGEAMELIGTAFAHYSVIVNGGGPEIGEVFQHDGMEYRFMGEDFSTKEEVLSYLQEKYTGRTAAMIYNEIPFLVLEEKLAQPNKYVSGNLLWADGEVQQLSKDEEKTRLVTYKVPVDNSDRYQTFELPLQYENGWKLDEQLPFTHGDNLEGSPQAKDGASEKEFSLTDEEQTAYEKFSLDFNEEHLRNLDPISIAKLYVYADSENNQEVAYALYTDREGYVQWTKEEHLEMTKTEEHSEEKILEAYNGLPDGEFLEDEDGESGYIKFYNANGMMGFQMIKDEDGIWNVSYMPIQ